MYIYMDRTIHHNLYTYLFTNFLYAYMSIYLVKVLCMLYWNVIVLCTLLIVGVILTCKLLDIT